MTTPPKPIAPPEKPEMDTFDARELIKDGHQVAIVLDDTRYVLRITRAGKLILNK
ncbi:MAG: hemin uptake protein HemP [Pseudomonadota bacterium]